MKKYLFVLLVAVISIACLTLATGCEERANDYGLRFALNEDKRSYSVVARDPSIEEYKDPVIPTVYKNKPVTAIRSDAFRGDTELIGIKIPASIEIIGDHAFDGCVNLTDLTFDEGSELYIGDGAFFGCTALRSAEFPDVQTAIGDEAFSGCTALDKLKISSDLISVGRDAFFGCPIVEATLPTLAIDAINKDILQVVVINGGSDLEANTFAGCVALTNVKIGSELTSIGDMAFSGCENLQSVNFDSDSKLQRIGKRAFFGCAKLGGIDLPSTVTEIDEAAFAGGSGITSINIPASMNSIGDFAFADCCDLRSVTFERESSLRRIGERAFANCTVLGRIEIPSKVNFLGKQAFDSCTELRSVEFEDGSALNVIGQQVFAACKKLESMEIPSDITSIGSRAFYDTAISEVYYGGDAESWCNILFTDQFSNPLCQGAKLFIDGKEANEIVIPDSITKIRDYTFYGCLNLHSVQMPSGLKSVGRDAFYSCPIREVTMPTTAIDAVRKNALTRVTINGGDSISEGTFDYCSSLESVTISDSVTSFGSGAFDHCQKLNEVRFVGDLASWCNIDFADASANPLRNGAKLFIDGEEAKNLVFGQDINAIKAYTFCGCTNLESVQMASDMIDVGQDAFLGCGIKYATVPATAIPSISSEALIQLVINGGDSIGDGMLEGCVNLSDVSICEGVRTIGQRAFFGCESLSDLTIPQSLTSIASRAFYGCTELESIFIPAGAVDIAQDAFLGCGIKNAIVPTVAIDAIRSNTLQSVELNGGDNIQDKAFAQLKNLESVVIPATVTEIGKNAFYSCSKLTKVTFASDSGLRTIGKDAFARCKIREISIPKGVTKISGYAFESCTSLVSIEIPEGVTIIEPSTFHFCSGLKTVKLHEGLERIDDQAFEYCGNLENVEIPSSVKVIGAETFSRCDVLSSVTFGKDSALEYMYSFAFRYCKNLRSIEIPSSLGTIGEETFFGCNDLQIAYYHGTPQQWRRVEGRESCFLMLNKLSYYSASDPSYNSDYDPELSYWHYGEDGKTFVLWQRQ